jgi:hypothetical protein
VLGRSQVVGVRGESTGVGTARPGAGVFGDALEGTGVYGKATDGAGIYGTSTNGYGVNGFSINNIGVYANSSADWALFASSAAGTAGQFNGKVVVKGDLTATGAKSAAVPHPDGSYRRLYAVESPESWFEDLGEGELQGGQAEVAIDPDFAALVRGDTYQVLVTPYGDCQGLYVSERSPTAFTVRELQGGTSNITFSYRVLAKRKDIEAPRLERVELPVPPDRPEPPNPLDSLELPPLLIHPAALGLPAEPPDSDQRKQREFVPQPRP